MAALWRELGRILTTSFNNKAAAGGRSRDGKRDRLERLRQRRGAYVVAEALEQRQMLSLSPIPQVTGHTTMPVPPSPLPNTNISQPSVTYDPINPFKLVSVYQSTNGSQSVVYVSFSTDGGTSWSGLGAVSNRVDFSPAIYPAPPVAFAFADSPALAFDRQDNFYVTYRVHNADIRESGEVVIQKFTFTGAAPATVGASKSLYQWSRQDPAYAPTVAADATLAAYTDPGPDNLPGTGDEGGSVANAFVNNVYVAWATDNDAPTAPFDDPYFTPNTIKAAMSRDGGTNYTTTVLTNDGGNSWIVPTQIFDKNTAPKLVVSQGTADGTVTPGQLNIFWDDFNGGCRGAVRHTDCVRMDAVQDGGTGLEVSGTGGAVNDALPGIPFLKQSDLPTSDRPVDILLLDVNNDTILDILTLNAGVANAVTLLQGSGGGNFNAAVQLIDLTPFGNTPTSMVSGLFNNDTIPDLAVTMLGTPGKVVVFFGDGAGAFINPASFNVGNNPQQVVATADVSGDNKLDLVVANGSSNSVSILRGDGNGGFVVQNVPNAGAGPSSLVVGDFTGDGKRDIVVANGGASTVTLLTSNAGNPATFAPTAFNVGAGPSYLVAADINKDNKVDLIVSNGGAGTLSILRGTGLAAGPFLAGITIDVPGTPRGLFVGEVTGDTNPDIIYTDIAGNTVQVLVGDGTGSFSPPAPVVVDNAPIAMAAADINADTKIDLLVANRDTDDVSVLMGGSNSSVHLPRTTNYTLDLTGNAILTSGTFTLADFDVKVSLVHLRLDEISISLTAPTGEVFPLLLNRTGPDGAAADPNDALRGRAGSHLGVITYDGIDNKIDAFPKWDIPTVFDMEAARTIKDPTSVAPFTAHFRPEAANFHVLDGKAGTTLAGVWTLTITDFRNDPPLTVQPTPNLDAWGLQFRSGFTTNALGGDIDINMRSFLPPRLDADTTRGALSSPYPNRPATLPEQGIGVSFAVASNNTLGDFSPYAGILYLTYTSGGGDSTDVQLAYSPDGGVSWIALGAVNDDDPFTDGFSEGNRAQFQSNVAVDQSTGAVVVTYYDARYDGARRRVARMVAYSIDGGGSFQPQTFANVPNAVTDAITGELVELGPTPDNQSDGNPNRDPLYGFGDHQGLAVVDGKVFPMWSGNLNGGTLRIQTAKVSISAGPRIIDSTMGPVSTHRDFINPSAADGTPQVTAFQVVFDRPIDPASFDITDITVTFRDENTNGLQAGVNVAVGGVTPLDATPLGATTFLITLATPQSATGTYSYQIDPSLNLIDATDNGIVSRIRHFSIVPKDQIRYNSPANQNNLPVPTAGTGGSGNPALDEANSIIAVAGVPGTRFITDVNVEVVINHTFDSDLAITLIAPDGTAIPLAFGAGGSGDNFNATQFDDQAFRSIYLGLAPFVGKFQPDSPLGLLNGNVNINGDWTLNVSDGVQNNTGILVSWALILSTGAFEEAPTNLMDQNLDGTGGQPPIVPPADVATTIGDVYAIPRPLGRDFIPVFDKDTLPLIVPGPHLVQGFSFTSTAGQSNLPIPPGAPADAGGTGDPARDITRSTIVINEDPNAVIVDMQVTLNIAHTFDSDLILTLIAPDGTEVLLANRVGFDGDDFVNTVLDDTAPCEINPPPTSLCFPPTAPMTDVFIPEELLTTLRSRDLNGVWQLKIEDVDGRDLTPDGVHDGEVGTLINWTLTGHTEILYRNQNVDHLDVKFDRDMDPTSLDVGDIFRQTGPIGAITGPQRYTSVDLNKPIGDANGNTPLISTLKVNDNFTIGDLNVQLDITHQRDNDLRLTLIAPNGTRIPLATKRGGTGQNYTNTLFDDQATTAIANGASPFNFGLGFQPESPLRIMHGLNVNGTWRLEVIDDTVARTGTLNGWSIIASPSGPYRYTAPVTLPIPDNTGSPLVSTITVPDSYSFSDLNVEVDITHTNDSDLTVTLISPSGRRIALLNKVGAAGDNFTNTLLDDEATALLAGATAPFDRILGFKPASPLSILDGTDIHGTWQLEVLDDTSSNTGTLKSWSLLATPNSPRTYNSGAVNTPVADNATTQSTITVLDNLPAADINVRVDIDHANLSQISLSLITPGNVEIPLVVSTPNGGTAFDNTLFDDASTTSINTGAAPYNAVLGFAPSSALTGLAGINVKGDWKLKIVDNAAGSTGTLNSWSIIATPSDPLRAYRTTDFSVTPDPVKGQQFTTTTPVAIPDNTAGGATATLVIPDNFTIGDLNVKFDITHPDDGDLAISLIAPNGRVIPLVTNRGAGTANFTGTLIDDEAPNVIATGVAPFNAAGGYTPEAGSSLAILNGVNINGTWRLKVVDSVGGDAGTINSFSLVASSAKTPVTRNATISNLAIPDNNTLTPLGAPITIIDEFKISDLNVRVDVTHARVGDLKISLIAPDGTKVLLADHVGANGDSFAGTIFDDSGATPIAGGSAPFNDAGRYIPATALSAFNGKIIKGTWRLEVVDDTAGNTGQLNGWSIIATPEPLVYFSGTLNTPITDNNAATPDLSTISVPDSFAAADVNVTVNLNHTQTGDLQLTLIHPSGLRIPLATNRGGAGDNFTSTLFDDAATTGIAAGVAPFNQAGGYSPESPLAALNSLDVRGDWQLEIVDNSAGQTGTLLSWSMTLTPEARISDPDPANPRTYRLGFPQQRLSGTYTFRLGNNIHSEIREEIDNNLNAGVNQLRDQSAVTTNVITAATDIPQTIGSTTTAGIVTNSSINITDPFLVQGVSLQLNIRYNRDPDLEAYLIGPDGTTVTLFQAVGNVPGLQRDFANTIFANNATTLIKDGAPPFAGSFHPQGDLTVFNNTPSTGLWTLKIVDTKSGLTGQLLNWTLTLIKPLPNSGLGDVVADESTPSFRIFTQDPTIEGSHQAWTAVGGQSQTNVTLNDTAGRVSAIAVDPSDPSGNTVYVGGASGGVWKTTNFLTTSPQGPTWTPLTDFGPTYSLNVGSIAVLGRNKDTNQSVIFAVTGEGDSSFLPDNTTDRVEGFPNKGVGFLRSLDGGATWTLLDSSTNVDANGEPLPLNSPQRDHIFVGSYGFKVVVDPRVTPGGEVIIYAALSGFDPTTGLTDLTKGGIWRSLDSGKHWQHVLTATGIATDVLLDPNSGYDSQFSTIGNLQAVYGAFSSAVINGNAVDGGIWRSPNRGGVWNKMIGGIGDPLIFDTTFNQSVPVLPPPSTPSGTALGRVVLATPETTGNPVEDVLYQGWLYAVVTFPGRANTFDGLYMTKDFGQNWAKIHIDGLDNPPVCGDQCMPTNDTTVVTTPTPKRGPNPVTDTRGRYNVSMAIDPNNPNVVFIGGEGSKLIRVDTEGVSDAHAFFKASDRTVDAGSLLQPSVDPMQSGPPPLLVPPYHPMATPYMNLIQDPATPFAANSTIPVQSTPNPPVMNIFFNGGTNAKWIPLDTIPRGYDSHRIVTMKDPLTGHTRLLLGDNLGVFTGVVDEHTGLVSTNIGTAVAPLGARNGNLQIAQFYYGAVQPSDLAANIAKAMFYGSAHESGFPVSTADILTTGNTYWTGEVGHGGGVATDQTGHGDSYIFQWPCCGSSDTAGFATNFFLVKEGTFANYVGRTNQLLQVPNNDPQWPRRAGSNFAVNPVAKDQIMISSQDGRVFGTETQGRFWSVIGDPGAGALDGSYAGALAYGAPDPAGPGGSDTTNFFLYAGTENGNIFVTFAGGGGNGNAWLNLSNGLPLDNNGARSPIRSIVTNPTRGSHEAYALTARGVYHMPDATAANAAWIPVTGNLPAQSHFGFDQVSHLEAQPQELWSLAVDWRYVIPDDFNNVAVGTHPVLYVGAEGGVYRTFDAGAKTGNGVDAASWRLFPDVLVDNANSMGGYLPNAHVTDLDLSLGNIDPTTGFPVLNDPNTGAKGPDLLLATTFGRGQYTIRLGPVVVPGSIALGPGDDTGIAPEFLVDKITKKYDASITGYTEQSAFGNTVRITLYDMADPLNPRFIGGYNTQAGFGSATDIPANQTDQKGKFTVPINPGAFLDLNGIPIDGVKTIGVQASDDSGTLGVISTFQFTLDTTPPLLIPKTFNVAEGTNFNGAIASFINDSIFSKVTNVDWGDGSTSPSASIVANAGSFDVIGAHRYLDPGTFNVQITITDPTGNVNRPATPGHPLPPDSTANVTNPAVVATGGFTLNGSEGVLPAVQTLATFIDPSNTNEPLNQFEVQVNWGDGSPVESSATVNSNVVLNFNSNSKVFTVTGTHLYADGQTYPIAITIKHGLNGQVPAPDVTVNSTARIADTPVVGTGGFTFNAVENAVSATQTVATFTDANPENVSHYSATINWGDGQSEAGTITFNGGTNFTVTGQHKYDEEGNFTINVSIVHDASTPTSVNSTAVVSDPAVVATGGFSITAVEGVPFASTTVATFTDAGGPDSLGVYTASINWGDGTSSNGSITLNGNDFTVAAGHQYQLPGVFTITTTISHGLAPNSTATSTATVSNPGVILTGGFPFNASQGQPSTTQVVATFTDPGGPEATSDYSATIAWGDNLTSAGVITFDAANNLFTVSGSHTYNGQGQFTITITVNHTPNAPSATTTSTAVVTGPLLVNGGFTVSAVEGVNSSQQLVATFTDPSGSGNISNYSANIDWGDGSSSAGAITLDANNLFSVFGDHTYADPGNFPINVTVFRDLAQSSAASTAVVSNPPVQVAGGFNFTIPLGTTSGTQTVATFVDPGGPEGIGNYTATINWGDGSTDAGAISFDGNTNLFSVTGAHTYSTQGSFTITTTVNHTPSAPSASATSLATVAGPVSPIGGFVINAVEGAQSGSQTVATFTDPSGAKNISEYSAQIAWGDNTTSAGSITFNSGTGVFTVSGNHVYNSPGNFTITTTIRHDPAPAATAISSAVVSNPSVKLTGGFNIPGVEGTAFTSQTLATFTDPGGPEAPDQYSALINWGDNTTSNGVISFNSQNKVFSVLGGHTYGDEGTFTISITVNHTTAPSVSTTSSATISNPQVIARGGFTFSAVEGALSTEQTVATFTDPGGAEPVGPSNYTANINWGDGQTTPGLITFNPANNTFSVTGAHLYDNPGRFNITSSIRHRQTAAVTAVSTANVSNPAVIATGGLTFVAVEGIDSDPQPTASFIDPGGLEALSAYTATINWGDGLSSAGVISFDAINNIFFVSGSHRYNDPGQFTITTTIKQADSPAATAESTADVSNPPVVATGGFVLIATEGIATVGDEVLATFTDPGGAEPVSQYSTTIDWGDGTNSDGIVTFDGSTKTYRVGGIHAYLEPGSFDINVTIHQVGGLDAVTTATASVTDAPITLTAINIDPDEGVFTGDVATFTSDDITDPTTSFTGIIGWGDGTASSAAVITAEPNTPGKYIVSGTHAFPDGEKRFSTTITITSNGGSTGSDNGVASVHNVPPTLTLEGPPSGFVGQAIVFTLNALDPATADQLAGFTYGIDWGDGSGVQTIGASTNNGVNQIVSHAYPASGTYNIQATATDKDAGVSNTVSLAVQVFAAPTLTGVLINGGESQRSRIDSIEWTFFSPDVSNPVPSLTIANLKLLMNGNRRISLSAADLSYDPATSNAILDLRALTLSDGDFQLQITVGDGVVLPINFFKLAGDTDKNGIVNSKDETTVRNNQGSNSGSSGFNPNADLSGDGVVNNIDLKIVQKNLGHQSKAKKATYTIGSNSSGRLVLDFGTVTLGQIATPIELTIKNPASAPARRIRGLSIAGSSYSFIVVGTLWGNAPNEILLNPGKTVRVRVFLNATRTGPTNGQLRFTYRTAGSARQTKVSIPLTANVKGGGTTTIP